MELRKVIKARQQTVFLLFACLQASSRFSPSPGDRPTGRILDTNRRNIAKRNVAWSSEKHTEGCVGSKLSGCDVWDPGSKYALQK